MSFRPVLVLMALLTAGCHAHTPLPLSQVTPGEQVRMRISQEQARALEHLLLRERQVLDGTVVEIAPQLLIEVFVATHLQGGSRQDLRQRIALEPSEVLGVERRELDKFRTGLAITAGSAILAGSIVMALTRESGGDTRGSEPAPGELRGPTVHIPWRSLP
jgi:hypothetical protein